MKPLGIKAKVALATSLTSIAMIALVTLVQVQRMRDDFTKVLLSQQTAMIDRTAEELDDKLGLIGSNPDVFFTIPHFASYEAVLIVLDRIDLDQLDEVLIEAWLARAPKRLVASYLDAPRLK